MSPSFTHPALRQKWLMTGQSTAGSTKQIMISPSQSMPVIASFAPDATSFTQPE